jgi:hypothetical protein
MYLQYSKYSEDSKDGSYSHTRLCRGHFWRLLPQELAFKYYMLIYENGKMRPVQTIPRMGMRGGRNKGE